MIQTILYTHVKETTLAFIQDQLRVDGFVLTSASDTEISGELKKAESPGVLLIGELAGNPIRLAQEAYSIDKYLSILLITESSNYNKLKQALQYTPFIGPTIQCVSNSGKEGLAAVVEDQISRTQQRRNYAAIKVSASQFSIPSPYTYAKITEGYLDKVLAQAPVGAVLLTQSGTILAFNAFASRLFNKTEIDVLGKPFDSLFTSKTQTEVAHFIEQSYRTNAKRRFENESEEQKQFLEITLADIMQDGRSEYKMGIIVDITPFIHFEQRLKTANDELTMANEELAAVNEELAAANEEIRANNEELSAANSQLLRTNTDLDNFIYTASHDLKAPISNIESLLSALMRTLPVEILSSGRVQRITSSMQESVERFKRTIANLTEVVKLQKENSGEAVAVDLSEVIRDVRLDLEPMIKAAQAQVEVEVASCPSVRFSEKNLRSVVYNLLSNALKYRSPDRVPRVRISCSSTPEYYVLSIEDNGLGMESGRLSQLFTMFKRFHDHVEGSGIGLYMVKKIVENAGGKIEVETTLGVGSTFKVYFKG